LPNPMRRFAPLLLALLALGTFAAPARASEGEAPDDGFMAPYLFSYGRSPDGAVTQRRLGFWADAHGDAVGLTLNRLHHPRLGVVTAAGLDLQTLLPLTPHLLPVVGLGAQLGSAGGTRGAVPVVASLAPQVGLMWLAGERVTLGAMAQHLFWSTGRRDDNAVVSLEWVVIW